MPKAPSPLLESFRSFYGSFADLCARLESPDPPPPALVQQEVAGLIEREQAGLRHGPERCSAERQAEFTYALAALADELLLAKEWPGRAAWPRTLAETRLFGSRAAGQRVFERIDSLVAGHEHSRRNFAPVYLLLLGLGFRGRFRQPGASAELDRRRAELWLLASTEEARADDTEATLTPSAYRHTITEGELAHLPTSARWWLLCGAVVLVWLAASTLLWRNLTADLIVELDHLERTVAATERYAARSGSARR